MELFGLAPFAAAVIITAVGVSLSVLLGWLKGSDPINPRQIVASGVIAFIFSFQIVAAEISILPAEIEELALGMIIFALVAQVSGIDSLAKSGAKAILKAKKS